MNQLTDLLHPDSWFRSLLHLGAGAAPVSDYEAQILSKLKTEGVCVTSAQRLVSSRNSTVHEALRAASRIVLEEPASVAPSLWTPGASSTDLRAEVLLDRLPGVYLLGLDEAVLRIVELYLKTPAAYHGGVLRHSAVNGGVVGTKLWHQDAEDAHVFRMVLYLNDVDMGGGPFEYIPRDVGVTYSRFKGRENVITNEVMEEVVPRSQWKQVTGPAGTIVICDTAKVFHHESVQLRNARAVVMFGFSSRSPRTPELARAHFPVERLRADLERIVPAASREPVFGWR